MSGKNVTDSLLAESFKELALRVGYFAGDYHEKRVRPHLEISMAHAGAHFRVLCPVDVFRGDCMDQERHGGFRKRAGGDL